MKKSSPENQAAAETENPAEGNEMMILRTISGERKTRNLPYVQKIIEFISRIIGSYTSTIIMISSLSGGWPAIVIGFFILENLLIIKEESDKLVMLGVIVALMIFILIISAASYGALRKIGLKAWFQIANHIDRITINGRVANLQDFYERAIKEKFPILMRIPKNKNDKVKAEIITREQFEAMTPYRREKVYLYNLRRGLRENEGLTMNLTFNSFWAVLFITVPFFFFEIWFTGSYANVKYTLPTLVIGQVFFHTFFFALLELNTAPLRKVLKELINPRIHRSRYSIKLKLFMQVFVIVLSLVALFIVMKEESQTAKNSVVFVVVLCVIAIYLTTLYIQDLMRSVHTFASAVRDLGQGGNGELFLASVDKEFTLLGNDFSRAAREVNDYRHNLEQIVAQKTVAIRKANVELNHKNEIMDMELNMASSIQRGLLPRMREWQELDFAYFYRPMVKVSGDYFDMFELSGGRLGILIADVSGHGIPACLITSMGKLSFVTNCKEEDHTDKILNRVNRDLNQHVKTQDYMTAFFFIVNPDYSYEYTNASHQLVYQVTPRGDIRELDSNGFFLGVDMEVSAESYENRTGVLEAGDMLVLYTDGLTEMRSKEGEEYGSDRLKDFIRKNLDKSLDDLAGGLQSDFFDFIDTNNISDDITFLVVRRRGSAQTNGKADTAFRARLLQARQFINDRQSEKGFEILEELRKLYPSDPQVLFPLAKREHLKGNIQGALDILDQIKGIDTIRNGQLRDKIVSLKNTLKAAL